MRTEIKLMELEIAEKSKNLKEIERDKLVAQVQYSEITKQFKNKNSKKQKCYSSCNTYSSLPKDRSANTNYSKDSSRISKRSSFDIEKMLKTNLGAINITKNIANALDTFAPGQGITAKVIAFNRGGFNMTSRGK